MLAEAGLKKALFPPGAVANGQMPALVPVGGGGQLDEEVTLSDPGQFRKRLSHIRFCDVLQTIRAEDGIECPIRVRDFQNRAELKSSRCAEIGFVHDSLGDINALDIQTAFQKRESQRAHAKAHVENPALAAEREDLVRNRLRVRERMAAPTIRARPILGVLLP